MAEMSGKRKTKIFRCGTCNSFQPSNNNKSLNNNKRSCFGCCYCYRLHQRLWLTLAAGQRGCVYRSRSIRFRDYSTFVALSFLISKEIEPIGANKWSPMGNAALACKMTHSTKADINYPNFVNKQKYNSN